MGSDRAERPVPQKKRMQVLQRVAKAMQEMDDYALTKRHAGIEGAPGIRPVMAAVLVVLLRWPDTELPMALIKGFDLTDDVGASNIYRPIEAKTVGKPVEIDKQERLLGEAAATFVDELEANRTMGPMAEVVYSLTQQEV